MRNDKKFSSVERAQIRYWKKKITNINLYRKLEVLNYAALGYTNKEISKLTDFSVSRVSDFIREYKNNGIGYFLEEHRKGGNRRNLTDEQERRIIEEFREKAIKG